MVGLLGQDLAVKRLGLLQPPGLVVLQCQINGLLDRELGHDATGQYPVRIALSQQTAMGCLVNSWDPMHCGILTDRDFQTRMRDYP
jgi:hypothetical protein